MEVGCGHEPEAWCDDLKFMLDRADEVADFGGWTSPEHEAVPGVSEGRVCLGTLQFY